MFDNNIMISSVAVTWTVSEAVQGGNTWSGYKAVFDSGTGTWSFESDATAGLTYTSVTPTVGSIYSADALARIQSLYQGEPSGLIFRAPLASDLVDIVGGVQGESWGHRACLWTNRRQGLRNHKRYRN